MAERNPAKESLAMVAEDSKAGASLLQLAEAVDNLSWDSILHLEMENEKFRSIPCNVVPPLSVSASRGVACVLAARKQALVYILDEDEDEISDSE